ncbi:MAG TPA: formylglycine-generating enzyme family protein [Vicinamibacterales bacterium]|nr:formylglycine-generating enzyme family protein [Vicinamibacterales bacterium]
MAPSIAVAFATAFLAGALPHRTEPFTGMVFVRIAAVTFEMGSPPTERDREEVRHLVAIVRPFYLGVYEVSQQELSSWPGFRLPTEAEWEYACRAGGTAAYGAAETIDTSRANYNGARTKPVGSYPPNAWGLFDMSGNVWEWTADDYAAYPGATAPDTPSFIGERKVIRGGSWRFGADSTRCACATRTAQAIAATASASD